MAHHRPESIPAAIHVQLRGSLCWMLRDSGPPIGVIFGVGIAVRGAAMAGCGSVWVG
jgi:hypothetical protein